MMPSKQPVQPARGADIVVVNNSNDDPMISPSSSSSSTKSDAADDEMNRQKAAVAADAIHQLHDPVAVLGADDDNDESSITTRPPTAASRNVADAAGARRATFDEATHIAQATHNSLRDAVGAFRVSTSRSRGVGVVATDDDDETTEAGGSAQTNLTSMATAGSAQTSIYTNDNLPPNIDIIAEATLVESSERPGGYDEENPVGGSDSHSDAVCEHRSSSDQGGGNDPSDRSNGDDNNNPSTDTKPAAAVVAEPMDRFTIYLCGRHARFQIWHLVLIAAIAIALCVAIPVAVTSTNKSKEPPVGVQEQSFLWTEEELYKIVAPSISDPSTLFLEYANGSGSGTPDNFNPSDHTNHTPQEHAFQWLSDSLTSTSNNLLIGPTKQSLHWRIQQRYILAVLYYSTNGEEWKNQYGFLQTDIHECEWNGGKELNNGWKSMDCNDVGEITLMNLWQNNLQGSIPRELASLPLTAIDFLTNGLTGSIPEEMYTLKDLNYLNLGYNELTGTVASELGNLDKFTYLMLDSNKLHGTIPSELGKLTQLSGWLSLENNDLTGTVPKELAQLTQATWIYFNRNNLKGSIEFMCDALKPTDAPNGMYKNETSALSELYADRNKVECSCCNCCPHIEEEEADEDTIEEIGEDKIEETGEV